jgi:hypothetical protein
MKDKKIVVGLLAALSLPSANVADSLFVQDVRITNEINFEKSNRELTLSSKRA